MRKPTTSSSSYQAGFASFAVTMVIMIVISLIVLGFATNSRLEQRRALDSQLSTEAYDAAESGINDAYALIEKGINQTPTVAPQNQSSCTGGPYSIGSLAAGNSVEVSCLLVDVTPDNLQFTGLASGKSEVVPLEVSSGGNPITEIDISWQEHGQQPPVAYPSCPNAGTLPSEAAWPAKCKASLLQVDIVPSAGWTAANINSYSQTFYLEPNHAGNSSYALNNANTNGALLPVHCNTGHPGQPYDCNIKLTNMITTDPYGYYLRITPFYLISDDMNIIARDSSSNPLNIVNSQAVVDSTGRAQDVLKRIQERICINNVCNSNPSASGGPVGAIESTNGICKLFEVSPGFYGQDDGAGNSCSSNPY